MGCLSELWTDERGFVLSAEAVVIGTVGVIGATVGLTMAANSIHEELKECAFAFRSLDQSYSYQGFSSSRAATAGSKFQQQNVEVSLSELRALEEDSEEPDSPKSH